ncbi:hypothetical protein [Sphingobacterium suaedae]|uniref:PorT family protein n=1 Tax=Sphingobacterium suaedae TaxID=1686402 RepID=A0ABW5KH59_9SPHI
MGKLFALFFACLCMETLSAQTEADTIHYRKIYYLGGTGLSFPLGKTNEALTTKLFSGSAGLDIALKDPQYFLTPTLYMLTFGYDQLIPDPNYNHMIENGRASFYMLSLAAGKRKQVKRLNSYAYLGPAMGLITEPRGDLVDGKIKMENKRSFTVAGKMGIGSDYKFPGFFIGAEIGYLYNLKKIEGNPVHFLTIMVGLKSDITRLSEKVTDVIGIDTYK